MLETAGIAVVGIGDNVSVKQGPHDVDLELQTRRLPEGSLQKELRLEHSRGINWWLFLCSLGGAWITFEKLFNGMSSYRSSASIQLLFVLVFGAWCVPMTYAIFCKQESLQRQKVLRWILFVLFVVPNFVATLVVASITIGNLLLKVSD